MRRPIKMFALFICAVLLCVGVEHQADAGPQATPQDHLDRGHELYEKGDLNGAMAEYRVALRLEPNNAIAHYYLGAALGQKNDAQGEIAEYRASLRINDKIPDVHFFLGMALRRKGDLDGAIAEFRAALSIRPDSVYPNSADAHLFLGMTLHQKGDLDGAITEFHAALSIRPDRDYSNSADAHWNLGTVLAQKGDTDRAIAEFRVAIRLKPGSPVPHLGLSMALQAKGYKLIRDGHDEEGTVLYDQAYLECGRALALDPKSKMISDKCDYLAGFLGKK